MFIETEVKVQVPIDIVETTRTAWAWCLEHPRTLEDNALWDTPSGDLRTRGELLRLRRYGDTVTLTWKGRPDEDAVFKRRLELEAVVSDATAVAAILRRLGLTVWFRYQKYRTLYRYGDVHIAVDETPLGVYVELEGSPEAIEASLRAFRWEAWPRTTATYYEIFQTAVREGRWTRTDLTFNRFGSHEDSFCG
ncbi:MAG: class IV adenylate cyclase [Acidobacteria bacterium]|nr:class IV adenylate cyclase [Acidobacteriota bacterium]MDW7983669.1 class IV adenylate cyclase [Acidobacteriota bacterium]